MSWVVYLLECMDSSFYTGISNDLDKRINAHKNGRGSKYVNSRGFKQIIATKKFETKSEALRAEYQIKQLPREEKLKWFKAY